MGLLGKTGFAALEGAAYIAIDFVKNATVVIKGIMKEIFQAALDFMNNVIDKIQDRIVGKLMGTAHFFRMMGDKFQEGTVLYSIDEEIGEWIKKTVTRTINQNNVPESYMSDLMSGIEVNDTVELKNALQL